MQLILGVMKNYYEKNEYEKIKKIHEDFELKVKKVQRQNNNSIPYDLVQICKAKERQLSHYSKKKGKFCKWYSFYYFCNKIKTSNPLLGKKIKEDKRFCKEFLK